MLCTEKMFVHVCTHDKVAGQQHEQIKTRLHGATYKNRYKAITIIHHHSHKREVNHNVGVLLHEDCQNTKTTKPEI